MVSEPPIIDSWEFEEFLVICILFNKLMLCIRYVFAILFNIYLMYITGESLLIWSLVLTSWSVNSDIYYYWYHILVLVKKQRNKSNNHFVLYIYVYILFSIVKDTVIFFFFLMFLFFGAFFDLMRTLIFVNFVWTLGII